MLRYTLNRLLLMIPTLIGVAVLVFFMLRIVPGDVVEGRRGAVYVNGKRLDEPYLTQKTRPFDPVTVPAGKLFVMGDNRANSLDSRFGLGFVPIDKVIGKAFIKIWPPSRFGLLH